MAEKSTESTSFTANTFSYYSILDDYLPKSWTCGNDAKDIAITFKCPLTGILITERNGFIDQEEFLAWASSTNNTFLAFPVYTSNYPTNINTEVVDASLSPLISRNSPTVKKKRRRRYYKVPEMDVDTDGSRSYDADIDSSTDHHSDVESSTSYHDSHQNSVSSSQAEALSNENLDLSESLLDCAVADSHLNTRMSPETSLVGLNGAKEAPVIETECSFTQDSGYRKESFTDPSSLSSDSQVLKPATTSINSSQERALEHRMHNISNSDSASSPSKKQKVSQSKDQVRRKELPDAPKHSRRKRITICDHLKEVLLPPPEPIVYFHFVRHGEAYHNLGHDEPGKVNYKSFQIPDPSLTPNGIRQGHALFSHFKYHYPVPTVILTSSLSRAIETTLFGFTSSTYNSQTPKIIAYDELRECGTWECNKRKELLDLQQQYGVQGVDFSAVARESPILRLETTSRAKEVKEELKNIAKILAKGGGKWKGVVLKGQVPRKAMWGGKNPPDDIHIAVVSHGSFMSNLLEVPLADNGTAQRGFDNTELRTFKMIDGYFCETAKSHTIRMARSHFGNILL